MAIDWLQVLWGSVAAVGLILLVGFASGLMREITYLVLGAILTVGGGYRLLA